MLALEGHSPEHETFIEPTERGTDPCCDLDASGYVD